MRWLLYVLSINQMHTIMLTTLCTFDNFGTPKKELYNLKTFIVNHCLILGVDMSSPISFQWQTPAKRKKRLSAISLVSTSCQRCLKLSTYGNYQLRCAYVFSYWRPYTIGNLTEYVCDTKYIVMQAPSSVLLLGVRT